MEISNLKAQIRTETGKGAARRLRRIGMIPAVIYRDGKETLSLSVDPNELELAFKRSTNRNKVFELPLESGKRLCIVKEAQRHPLRRSILHVDFYELDTTRPVVVDVRIETSARCIGVKKGGLLKTLVRTLTVSCLPEHIPASIMIDIEDLDIGKSIRVADLPLPEGVKVVFDVNFNVVQVVGHQEVAAEPGAAPAAAAAAPGKAPAGGAKAPAGGAKAPAAGAKAPAAAKPAAGKK